MKRMLATLVIFAAMAAPALADQPDKSRPLYIRMDALICLSLVNLNTITMLMATDSPDVRLTPDCRFTGSEFRASFLRAIEGTRVPYWQVRLFTHSGQTSVWVGAQDLRN